MGAFETAASGLDPVVLDAYFRLYPNPATHQISFELFSDESPVVHLDFYDLMGRQLSGIDKVLTGGKNVITIQFWAKKTARKRLFINSLGGFTKGLLYFGYR